MSTQYEAPAITELGDFTQETGYALIADGIEWCWYLLDWDERCG
jgi:hypothetical protein